MKFVTPAQNARTHLGGTWLGVDKTFRHCSGVGENKECAKTLVFFLYCPSALGVHFLNDRSSAEKVGRGVGDKRQSALRYGTPGASAT